MTNSATGPGDASRPAPLSQVPVHRVPPYRAPRTYGELQESAARMLRLLIASDDVPVRVEDVDQMLQCRGGVIDALRQQLRTVGLNNHHPDDNHPGRLDAVELTDVDARLPTLLDQMAFELPTLPPGSFEGSLDALSTPSAHPTVEMWRETATALLAAAHTLDGARQRTWLRDDAAGWWLIRDSATTLEAVLVLDERLAEIGLLNAHESPHPARASGAAGARGRTGIGVVEKRMLASQCARVASWYGTSDIADRAALGAPPSEDLGPVMIVRTTADIARAQANLARYLRPTETRGVSSSRRQPLDTTTAKRVVASQLMLHRCFRHLALVTADPRDPNNSRRHIEHFTERIEMLANLQQHMHDLVDLHPTEGQANIRITWQQGELTSSLSRMRRDGVLTSPTAVTPDDLREIARTSHDAVRNLSVSLRRDLLSLETGLLERTATGTVPSPIRRRHPIERTLTELVNAPAPVAVPPPATVALQRAALRVALDSTPAAARPPSPWPAARKETSLPSR